MNSNAIVTLADSNYFELLVELINSIKTHEKSKSVSICVLDAGLTENQNKIIGVLVLFLFFFGYFCKAKRYFGIVIVRHVLIPAINLILLIYH